MFKLHDLMPPVPDHLEEAIVTPHKHEDAHHKPLWLIWIVKKGWDGRPEFPELDTVCDSPDSARYHVSAAIQSHARAEISVERIPANHRFASSLDYLQMDAHVALWKERLKRRDGD